MVDGKLVPGLRASLNAKAAFSKLLKARLTLAAKRCKELDGGAEAVHQLRVSTRRATAALRLAKDALPGKRRQRVVESLRNIRRAAGKVRDIDIFLGAIHDAHEISDSTRAFLAGHIAYSRVMNFDALQAKVAALLPDLLKQARFLPSAVNARNGDRFAGVLARHAKRMLREFHETLAKAQDNADAQHLHLVRIEGKRLRYSLELAHSHEKLANIVVQLEKLQEILGHWRDANDILERLSIAKVATAAVNGSAGSPVVKGIAALTRQQQRLQDRQLAAFRRWTKAWFALRKRNPSKALFPK
jgi:CHAD domain-containing protein